MTANQELDLFWVIGILLNGLFLVAVVWWMRRELRKGRELEAQRRAEAEESSGS